MTFNEGVRNIRDEKFSFGKSCWVRVRHLCAIQGGGPLTKDDPIKWYGILLQKQ